MNGWKSGRVMLLVIFLLAACSAASGEPGASTGVGEIVVGGTVEVVEVEESTAVPPAVELDNLGIAPEIINEVWINTDAPLTLELLRGKVVLVEFWTFG